MEFKKCNGIFSDFGGSRSMFLINYLHNSQDNLPINVLSSVKSSSNICTLLIINEKICLAPLTQQSISHSVSLTSLVSQPISNW